jgi:DNA-binding transcriptional ArsR family regulator
MIEERLAAVIRFVGDNEDVSVSRTAKQLGLSQSELLRLLAVLGDLGLIAAREDGSRRLLSLTADGHDWLAKHP